MRNAMDENTIYILRIHDSMGQDVNFFHTSTKISKHLMVIYNIIHALAETTSEAYS